MSKPVDTYVLDANLEPICPRDNNVMRYEATGIPRGTDNRPSYHCSPEECSVRYDLVDGYFTLMGASEHMYATEEPGVNSLKCEKHRTWLYRRRDQDGESGAAWCCGVEGCDYGTQRGTKGSWVRA
jgi:hypothetical protein